MKIFSSILLIMILGLGCNSNKRLELKNYINNEYKISFKYDDTKWKINHNNMMYKAVVESHMEYFECLMPVEVQNRFETMPSIMLVNRDLNFVSNIIDMGSKGYFKTLEHKPIDSYLNILKYSEYATKMILTDEGNDVILFQAGNDPGVETIEVNFKKNDYSISLQFSYLIDRHSYRIDEFLKLIQTVELK